VQGWLGSPAGEARALGGALSTMTKILFLLACFLPASPAALRAQRGRAAPPQELVTFAESVLQDSLGPSAAATIGIPSPDSALYFPIDSSCATAFCDCMWPWDRNHWLFYFHLDPARDSLRRIEVILPVTQEGALIQDYPPFGLPPCSRDPEACVFRLTRDSAIALARARGFPSGESPWSVTLRWLDPRTTRGGPERVDPRGQPPVHNGHWAWAIAAVTYYQDAAIRGTTLWLDVANGQTLGETLWGGNF
jgi:hypothetical protein